MTIFKIGLCGSTGKMGQAIQQIVENDPLFRNIEIGATFASHSSINMLDNLFQDTEVIIDFSTPDILKPLLEYAVRHQRRLVVGTTGLTSEHRQALEEASKKVAILYGANMSVGANIIAQIAAQVAKSLAYQDIYEQYDTVIIDKHHRFKKDSPSGTALMLADKIDDTLKSRANEGQNDFSPVNLEGKPTKFVSIKAGGIFGEHEVIFAGLDEVITIKHQALNRTCFAVNAIRAAMWLRAKPAGLYQINDILGYT